MSLPLAGLTILTTRPLGQNQAWVEALQQAGAVARGFPVIEIKAHADKKQIQQLFQRFGGDVVTIFVSPNAVNWTIPRLQALGAFKRPRRIAAIGAGTQAALADLGFRHVLTPADHETSEGLLALSAFQPAQIAEQRVLIITAPNGRELLAQTLARRGALVELFYAYQRVPMDYDSTAIEPYFTPRPDWIAVTSVTGLMALRKNLLANAVKSWQTIPLLVISHRIAGRARQLGFLHTACAKSPNPASLIDVIRSQHGTKNRPNRD